MDKDTKAILNRIATDVAKIAENTKPASRPIKILELVGLIATISGILGAIQLIIEWFLRR